jgi:2-methylcitrate dehydratase PrpD
MSFCERAGEFAAGLTAADVPERARERARLQRRAIVAAGTAGEAAAAPFAAVAPSGPLGEVYAGAAASIAHDWDDYLYMGHTGHSSVWTARAFAPGDDERALVAQVAANEVAGRLGAALLIGPHNGQFWSSIHCASAAVAAAVATGLDAERTAHALAVALYQPPYGLWPGFMGPATKLLTAADPAVQGARAALLAAQGVRGPLGVVEDPRGLLRHLSFAARPRMLEGLGSVWLTDTLAYKPYPGCAYLQAAVDAALRSGVEADDVYEIEVAAGYLTVAMERLGESAGLVPVGVNFSAARSVAIALVAGRLTHEELAPGWLAPRATELERLAGRVRVRHDWDLTLRTIRGVIDAGASIRDVPARAWPRVARRARELGMSEAALSLRDVTGLARSRRLRSELRAALRAGSGDGLRSLDTGRLRMTFPCRLRIRTHGGRLVEVDGEEPGASARPLEEQDAVVAARESAALTSGAVLSPRAGEARRPLRLPQTGSY